jgi:PBP1b-binding outer membrane lipoprotein LpoB
MKKIKNLIALALVAVMLSSCATVFGGKVTESQKRKPIPGEQQRQVRVGALIADIILFCPGLIIDFATGAIYKP